MYIFCKMILVYSIIKNKKEMLYKYKLILEKKLYKKNNILITLGNILTIFQLTVFHKIRI